MHNPLRSEAEMFRLVVIVGIAMGLVIIVALVIDPLAGAILLGVELGILIGILYRQARGSIPQKTSVAHSEDGVYRLVVVANQTVGGRALLEEVRNRVKGQERVEVLIVCPPHAANLADHLSSDIDGALDEARERLDSSLRAMHDAGINARGQLGDHHDPNQALNDALGEFAADEVVISTHPPERSRWLEGGVVEKAREEVPLPVTHVVVDLEAEATAVV